MSRVIFQQDPYLNLPIITRIVPTKTILRVEYRCGVGAHFGHVGILNIKYLLNLYLLTYIPPHLFAKICISLRKIGIYIYIYIQGLLFITSNL